MLIIDLKKSTKILFKMKWLTEHFKRDLFLLNKNAKKLMTHVEKINMIMTTACNRHFTSRTIFFCLKIVLFESIMRL